MKTPSLLKRATLTLALPSTVVLACSGGPGSVNVGDGGVANSKGGSSNSGAGGGGTSGSTAPVRNEGPTSPGPYDSCSTASDCQFGEINKEILQPSDCPCLYGCAFIPLSKTTVERRAAQYATFCTPHKDGQGHDCGVDDCAGPNATACVNNSCVVAPADAGTN
jgi:hypothetical protein